jgi:RNA polymerase sigma-70 factor (TIGR02960 family)
LAEARLRPTGPAPELELAAAVAGDADAFRRLTEGYARELHVHCYRVLGSIHDAEDALQETLVRAWRHLARFEGRSSFRAWLYRIATNVCLTRAARRRVEPPPLPEAVARAAARASGEPILHLSPYPDAWLDELEATAGNPAAEYELGESVQVAFLAAVQLLPPRQRAVLLLRDVLGFSAGEVADLFDSTTASVNSALQRARATLEQQRAAGRLQLGRVRPGDDVQQALVRRYVDAWTAADVNTLAALLTQDAVLTMPPLPLRYVGRQDVAAFFVAVPPGAARADYRFVPTRANRQPALAVYRLDPATEVYRAWGVYVLTLQGEAIAEITSFIDARLPPLFGLPAELARTDPRFAWGVPG